MTLLLKLPVLLSIGIIGLPSLYVSEANCDKYPLALSESLPLNTGASI